MVVKKFLGSYKSPNFVQIIADFLHAYQELGARMTLKIHFLHSHLDFFPSNMGDVSDEHGEQFYQKIGEIKNRYQGNVNENMMADYCWFIQIESDT